MLRRFQVRRHELGMLFKFDEFQGFVSPSTQFFFDPQRYLRLELHNLNTPDFDHPLKNYLLSAHRNEVEARFVIVETAANQVALVSFNGRLSRLVPPNDCQLFARGVVNVTVELREIATEVPVAIDPPTARQLLNTPDRQLNAQVQARVLHRVINDFHLGLLLVDGKAVQSLAPGLHVFWNLYHQMQIELFDLRTLALEVNGQELLTRDKLELRANLTCVYRVTDPLKLRETVTNSAQMMYRELQFALRVAIGTQTLDQLLEDKSAIDERILAQIVEKTGHLGIEVDSVGVKDLILPGEIRELLRSVVAAEKTALANNIRRREETAATRSLLNTARVMEENPVALRLKELESLEKLAEKVEHLSVVGVLDVLLREVVKLRKKS